MQDFSEINDFLSKEEIKKYIDDFLVSHQSLNDESIIDAFDQLCELADRQCNTYTILEKECRKVDEVTPKIRDLIEDMIETMYDANGVGLAAPQVGVLKQIVVIDTSADGEGLYVLINPEILETSGSQTGEEGCLSVPGMSGVVTRPDYVKVKAYDENMEEFILEGTELLARAICHETDHLHGKLYTELVEGELHRVNYEEEE